MTTTGAAAPRRRIDGLGSRHASHHLHVGPSTSDARVNRLDLSPHTLIGRVVRVPLALIPKSAVVPILRVPLHGHRWIVGSATHGSWLGTYEGTKQRLFASSVTAGAVVFDVGANVGLYTLIAAVRSGRGGRVFAFEPLPRNVDFLRRHLRYNQGDGAQVEVIEAGVGQRPGPLRSRRATLRPWAG